MARLKRTVAFLLVLCLSLVLFPSAAGATNRIFLLDTSGSMKKGGLFGEITRAIKNDYISQARPGEHIIVLSYDAQVSIIADRQVARPEDQEYLARQIDSLSPTGEWTWMSKALETVVAQAERLQQQYPGEELIIYFFTDGLNDPPPEVGEPPLKFVEILYKYFQNFQMQDAYVYVFTFEGITGAPPAATPGEKEQIERKLPGLTVVNSPSLEKPVSPEIRLVPKGFNFGTIDLGGGAFTGQGTITVAEIRGRAQGKEVRLAWDVPALLPTTTPHLSPEGFTVEEEGQVVAVTVQVPSGFPAGEQSVPLKLAASGVRLIPERFPIRFNVPRTPSPPEEGRQWWPLLLIILGVVVAYLLYLRLRRRMVWVTREGGPEMVKAEVRGWQPVSLETVGLPDCSLRLGLWPQELRSLFLITGAGREKISWGVPVTIASGDEAAVLTFWQDQPMAFPDTDEPAKTQVPVEENPDFFKEGKE